MMVLSLAGTGMLIEPRPFLLAALIFLVCAAALGLWGGVVWAALAALRRRQQLTRALTLTSQSNFETCFHLRAELGGLAKAFIIAWMLNQRAVRPQVIERVSYIEDRPARADAHGDGARRTGGAAGVKAAGKQVKEKARFLKGITSLFATISSSLGSILPRPLNQPFVKFADAVRGGQKDIDQAMSRPKSIATSGRQLKSSAGQLNKMTGSATGKTQGRESSAPPEPEKKLRRVIERDQVIATPPIGPAEELAVQLALRPRNPFRDWSGALTVTSQQLENAEFPGNQLLKSQQVTENITIRRLPLALTLLFSGLVVGFFALNAWAVLLMVQWLLLTLKV